MNKTELLAVIYNNTSKDIQRDDIIDAVEKYLSASNIWVETDKGSFAIYKIESGASNPFISYVKQLAIPIESPTSTDTGQGKVTVRKFMLKKFPTNEYMDCPVPQHHWETIQEYAEAYHASKSEQLNEDI